MPYKFVCDGCQKDVVQEGMPELCHVLQVSGSGKSRSSQTLSFQACRLCAPALRKEGERAMKTGKQISQVRPLRENFSPPKVVALVDTTSEKLDKLTELVANLANLVATQVQMNAQSRSPKPQERTEDAPKLKAASSRNTNGVSSIKRGNSKGTAREAARPLVKQGRSKVSRNGN